MHYAAWSIPMNEVVDIPDEAAMRRFGGELAQALAGEGCVIGLSGELGAGKTTLVRAMLWALGVEGAVRSPTYTLVESYPGLGNPVFHLDLYRLSDPEELEFLGIRDLDAAGNRLLVEWPERGRGALPRPDIDLGIALGDGDGRRVSLVAHGARGKRVLTRLQEQLADFADKQL